MLAIKRIRKDLIDFFDNPLENCSAGPIDENDLYFWQAAILGPDDSPYVGGVFFLDIRFPIDYPFNPPEIKFTTKIYHPKINSDGTFKFRFFEDFWSPTMTVSKLLLYI